MIRRLAEQGLDRARALSRRSSHAGPGRRAALRTIRRHRIIESYLTTALGYPWDRVHDEAERLEHAASDELIDRMAAAIGDPLDRSARRADSDARGNARRRAGDLARRRRRRRTRSHSARRRSRRRAAPLSRRARDHARASRRSHRARAVRWSDRASRRSRDPVDRAGAGEADCCDCGVITRGSGDGGMRGHEPLGRRHRMRRSRVSARSHLPWHLASPAPRHPLSTLPAMTASLARRSRVPRRRQRLCSDRVTFAARETVVGHAIQRRPIRAVAWGTRRRRR